ncbi:hypothetical protein PoB_004157300 [Plakobranchus ocellatus]|uniref:Uncharacterized protein n=1 Tax=Plakobranchus ocellatus TaxID=259542 RepID=A0AAV4B635_9GAST|nr:hypothetical protein PoB_004157300 [Plakobranchus ocellatus]
MLNFICERVQTRKIDPGARGHCADVSQLSDSEAWVATVGQPEKTTCGGTVPELLGTAQTQRPEGDPASRGRPYAQRETLRPEGDTSRGRPTPRGRPYVPRGLRPEGDPASRGRAVKRQTYAPRETQS